MKKQKIVSKDVKKGEVLIYETVFYAACRLNKCNVIVCAIKYDMSDYHRFLIPKYDKRNR